MPNTPHNNVDAAETERVLQLSIQELVMRSILASPTELQYVNYILEEALKESCCSIDQPLYLLA
jgi:hypothetical protein